ncbi:MAG TPA: formylglycine-generating enzyme family protein [Pirellulales bacterium]|nr:formylglycine-generating enzyme family protein [Pirellulales bacterium]
MNRISRSLPWLLSVVAIVAIGWGEFAEIGSVVGTGIGAIVGLAVIFGVESVRHSRTELRHHRDAESGSVNDLHELSVASDESAVADSRRHAVKPEDENLSSLVEQMLADGRFALLLRPQIAGNLAPEMLAAAQADLDRQMALVPDGEVQLEPNRLSAAAELDVAEEALERVTIHVAATFLDRTPVTNRQFQAFVSAGGYEQMAIWDPVIWPAMLDFVDSTRRPGPRYWIDGRCSPGKEDHPVIGICWYEAAAYARWIGRRLPTDAEWVKAASWPVSISPNTYVQRKYPWGNTMERQRANLWGSGPGGTAPVNEFASGVSVGGAYQLIGNVWEWTADNFLWIVAASENNTNQPLLKTIRGGAFDTYFDNQATSQFASGESPLGRKHNIGFRCALGICDLSVTVAEPAALDAPTELAEEEYEMV